MSHYLRLITEDDAEWTGKYGNCLTGDVTELTDLQRIERPHNNGKGRAMERIIVTHVDGTAEEYIGYILGSGQGEPPNETSSITYYS